MYGYVSSTLPSLWPYPSSRSNLTCTRRFRLISSSHCSSLKISSPYFLIYLQLKEDVLVKFHQCWFLTICTCCLWATLTNIHISEKQFPLIQYISICYFHQYTFPKYMHICVHYSAGEVKCIFQWRAYFKEWLVSVCILPWKVIVCEWHNTMNLQHNLRHVYSE